MRRHCNGQDPNLVVYVDARTGIRLAATDMPVAFDITKVIETVKPCDCGRVFDDVYRSTVYPHELI